ncbi:MAG: nucleotidyltransferase family protein, partial [Acidobacteriales bacterium]|nr:nucleotidyltransferase family protein [Terriglobales bacterium]
MSTAAATPEVRAQGFEIRKGAARFPPEFDLLLACLSTRGGAVSLQISNARRLIGLAEHHGLIPQLYSHLLANKAEPELLSAVAEHYATSSRRSLRLTAEMLRIASRLQSCGIQAMPYKGPVLAEFLYRDVTQRQFGDLDFLIHSSEVPAAKKALLDLGYTPTLDLDPAQERAYLATGNEYAFGNSLGSNLLEIQWRILPRFYSVDFDFNRFLQRAIEIDICGQTQTTLCAEDCLLVSCVHAAKHVWPQLSMLRDISHLAHLPKLNWDLVQSEGWRLGINRI